MGIWPIVKAKYPIPHVGRMESMAPKVREECGGGEMWRGNRTLGSRYTIRVFI